MWGADEWTRRCAREPAWLPAYVLVFAGMTGLWCLLGRWLVGHPRPGAALGRHGQAVLPFVLIALGLYVLSDARALLP